LDEISVLLFGVISNQEKAQNILAAMKEALYPPQPAYNHGSE
jgi:hypothetical protein